MTAKSFDIHKTELEAVGDEKLFLPSYPSFLRLFQHSSSPLRPERRSGSRHRHGESGWLHTAGRNSPAREHSFAYFSSNHRWQRWPVRVSETGSRPIHTRRFSQ